MISLSLLPYIVFVAVIISEIFLPQASDTTSDSRRWLVNAVLYVFNFLGARALFLLLTAIGLSAMGSVTDESSFMVASITIISSILLFDFGGYFVHRLYHSIPVLWKIHQIHHSDTKLDFSTGFRFHPLEMVITVSIDIILIVSFDIPAYAVAVHGSLIYMSGVIVHSNTTLFNSVDRVLRAIVVTPNMHHIHHSTDSGHYNKNFGVLLSFWDRLFGSYCALPGKEILALEYGVSGQTGPDVLKLPQLLLLPFKNKA